MRASPWLVIWLAAAMAAGCAQEQDPCPEVSGSACTWAGVRGLRGFTGPGQDDGDGNPLRESPLYFVSDLTFGPDGLAYVVDWNNHRIRRVEADGTFHTVIGTDYEGDGPPEMEDRLPPGDPIGAPGTTVALNHPTDVEFMPDGRLLLAAWHNNKLRVWDPETELVTVVAGNDYGYRGDGGPAYDAAFNQPKAVAVDPEGRIYTVDQRNLRIRTISPDAVPTIDTMAGTGEWGNVGDGGLATDAQFGFDVGVTPRPTGALALRGRELFVADSENHRIRRIDLDTGIVDCVAGLSSVPGYSGDGGSALGAEFNLPTDIEFGPDGRLYVADRLNNVVRAIDLENDLVDRVAGNGQPCPTDSPCFEAEDGLNALQIQLNEPYGIAFDAAGALYIADTHNSRIVQVTP